MPPSKTRFVTACQQMLALGVVVAALTPAASVVSLDVVRETPSATPSGGAGGAAPAAHLAAYVRESSRPSRVPTQVVDSKVREYSLTPAAGEATARLATRSVVGRATAPRAVTSEPEPVVGYGAVGVTWQHGTTVPERDISLQVRTRAGAAWSEWMDIPYDPDHGPDPGSAEARHARPGTDALLVGDVDDVQVQAVASDGTLPPDMQLAVIDPGKAQRSAAERPAIDTTGMGGDTGTAASEDAGSSVPASVATDPGTGTDGSDRIALQAAVYTPKPQIYSRAQWGADESMRDKSSLHYYEVHAGFVHHTVNANDYTRAEVPAIIRSIYAYHTQSRGWSDIGYNFLVDRFGRIWEGRYGGVDRPVVGAHTLNYNDYSFAMSAIGNYDIKKPSSAMVQAYGALFAWKLSLHGIDASSTKQWVGSRYFEAINGHRDAASTACPGKYLYAKIPRIRTLAAEAQRGWSGRELESNLASTPHPDLVVRRASDGRGFIIPTGGLTGFAPKVSAGYSLPSGASAVPSADLTGDGRGDLVVRAKDGSVQVLPGNGKGGFGAANRTYPAFQGHDLIAAVGDLNGDARNDLVARTTGGRLDAFLGRADGGFRHVKLGHGWGDYDLLVGAGDVDQDGHPDLLARDGDGHLWLHPGTGGAKFGTTVELAGSWSGWAQITGGGDYNADGLSDLFVRDAKSGAGYVIPSHGDGTFGHPLGPISRVAHASALLGGAPVVGNDAPDLVVRTGDAVSTLANHGTFDTGRPIRTNMKLGTANVLLNAGDWDRDGHGDVITRYAKDGSLYLRLGDGTGHFSKPRLLATGFGKVRLLAAVGDMTGDGYPDLMGQPKGGAMRIYPGNGLDGLKASYVAHSAIDAGRQVGVGRWDGDGAPDSLFRKGSKIILYPGNGPGGLTNPKSLGLDLSPYDWVVGVSDEHLTGHPDLIVRARSTGDLWLVEGKPGGFKPRRFLADGMGAYDLAG